MAIKETLQADHPLVQNGTTKTVEDFSNSAVVEAVTDLVDTMRAEELIGIAAPQLGIDLPIFVTEIRKTKFRNEGMTPLQVYINPQLSNFSAETNLEYEGCGSVENAGKFGLVERSNQVTIEAQNEQGETFTTTVEGLLARLIQHEYDHLEGILFTQRMAPEVELISRDAYLKLKGLQ